MDTVLFPAGFCCDGGVEYGNWIVDDFLGKGIFANIYGWGKDECGFFLPFLNVRDDGGRSDYFLVWKKFINNDLGVFFVSGYLQLLGLWQRQDDIIEGNVVGVFDVDSYW